MRNKCLMFITSIAVLAGLAIPVRVDAQETAERRRNHSRYKFYDLGTSGGANSNVNSDSVVINKLGVVVGGADTSVFNSLCNCFFNHAFKWHKNVLTDLGTLPNGGNSFSIAINDLGVVVGTSENGLINSQTGVPAIVATAWKNGKVIDLGTFGGSFSIAVAINDSDQIVGAAENSTPDSFNFGGALPAPTQARAALWENGRKVDLGALEDGTESNASFINDRGQIAGASLTDTVVNSFSGLPTVAPFLWENGRMINLGTLGGRLGGPTGLNDRGQVVGTSNLEGDQTAHPFLWERGVLRDLGTLGGSFGDAHWVNEKGEVVGFSTTANDEAIDAFLWRNGVMTDLGSVAGDGCSNAMSINSKGQVVGESFSCSVDSHHAFLWEKGGPAIDLNIFVPPGSGLHLTEAQFIGEDGEIAGVALLGNGDVHAFVLVPNEKEQDHDSEPATAPIQSGAVSDARTSVQVTHAKLTPEKLAELRARLARRNNGFARRPPQ